MSDLDQLRAGLDEALRTIPPGPAPVEATVRRGKGIRVRRRLTAVAGAAAVAVAALAGYPALAHKQAAPAPRPPVAHRQAASVTDVPPGPHAGPGVIATGLIKGQAWQLFIGKPGTHGLPSAPKGQTCFGASGSPIGAGALPFTLCVPFPAPNAAAPVSFAGFTCADLTELGVGLVSADVRYVVVSLSDGTRLKLIPVTVDGKRYVAFAIPQSMSVESARAYLSSGEYLTTIPFDEQNLLFFGMWQGPGQPVPDRITRTISSEPKDVAWWATAYAGPWGTCLIDTSNNDDACVGTSLSLGTQILEVASSNPCAVFGSAANGVSYLRITRTGGPPLRVRAVAVGNQKFFAFILGIGQSIRHWTAYDAAGKQVASGTATSP